MTINWEVIVMLYEHREYGGRKCPILESTPRLSPYDFNDKPSSIIVFQDHVTILETTCIE